MATEDKTNGNGWQQRALDLYHETTKEAISDFGRRLAIIERLVYIGLGIAMTLNIIIGLWVRDISINAGNSHPAQRQGQREN